MGRPTPTPSDEAAEFYGALASVYQKVVHWMRNIFNMSFGTAGGAFVDELADLIRSFAEATAFRKIAWKAVCVACHLLLQQPDVTGSALECSNHLECRLRFWKSSRTS